MEFLAEAIFGSEAMFMPHFYAGIAAGSTATEHQ